MHHFSYHYSWFMALGEPFSALAHALHLSDDQTSDVLTAWAVCLLLIGLALVARGGLSKLQAQGGTQQFVPEGHLTIRNFFEIYTGSIYNMVAGVMGKKDAGAFFWLFGGLFIYILFGNLSALLPGVLPPTDDVNNNAAMAVVVFLVFNIAGLMRNGTHYIKHLFGPVWWLGPLMFVIELAGLLFRPVSLTLRLAGNMNGDHTVFGIMTELIPVVLPSVFLGLGIFVSFVQAFVFTLLTGVYIALAVAHEENH